MSALPSVNATLNAVSGVLLLTGYICIRTGRWRAHATMMISATLVSTAFLACYLTYHYLYGERSTRASHAPHWLRDLYLLILFPHLILAVVMLPMIYLTLWRAYRCDWYRHKKIARPTFWIWLYVSVTGVVIYLLLYHSSLAS